MISATLKSDARKLIKSNAPKILFISTIYLVIITLISELLFRLPVPTENYIRFFTFEITLEQLSDSVRTYGLLLAFLLALFSPVISIGYDNYCLKTVRHIETDYKDLLAGFGMFFKAITLSIVISFFIALWSLLFFFPGIVAFYKYRQAYYILLDDSSKSVMQCINESKHLMYGKKVDLFLIDVSFFGWYVLNILVLSFLIPFFPVVSIWLTPYYGITHAAYYVNILKEVTV
jgi:uncharacterized membrane protein